MTSKGYTFGYYVSGHGFGHATRVNQIITELLKSTTTATTTTTTTEITSTLSASASTSFSSPALSASSSSSSGSLSATISETETSKSQHTIYIVSDAPEFIFQDVIALGAIYRNAKVDAGVVQPVAYYVDRQKTIDGCKEFLSKRDELIQREVSWLAQVGVDCVLADAPFLPCAAASAYGIPAILITNFTFDEVYRYLQEGDDFDKDVIACADAALEDYKKASLLLRLPGFIDIPSFGNEVVAMESSRSSFSSISDMDDSEVDSREQFNQQHQQQRQAADLVIRLAQKQKQQEEERDEEHEHGRMDYSSPEANMDHTTPTGILSPISMRTALSSPNPSLSIDGRLSQISSLSASSRSLQTLARKAIDVPLVVRMAVNTREVVLRSLGIDEESIATKKVALVSFGGQSLKEGWGNPLPEGWIGIICGLPADYEMPEGFYRSPHGVYVPDLTEAADVIIGKLATRYTGWSLVQRASEKCT
ncbi:hypothetical protein BGZ76_003178 [Entomortierella beljakovae]|nr:hypothetical protein BGZ76_003178 [Entomortierella beljakovae]